MLNGILIQCLLILVLILINIRLFKGLERTEEGDSTAQELAFIEAAKKIAIATWRSNETQKDDIEKLINHLAILNLAIAGYTQFKSLSNDSWASLPEHLTTMIEQAEERIQQPKDDEQ